MKQAGTAFQAVVAESAKFQENGGNEPATTWRVLVSDPISEKGIEKLQESGDLEVTVKTDLSPEALLAEIGEYDGLVVRSQTKVNAAVIAAGKRLKVIGRAGVGIDNVDVDAATARGVIVLNAPEGNTISAAEHTMALILSVARSVPQAHQVVKEGRWDRKSFMGVELAGKALGVIGFGRIGREVSRRALAFKMQVLVYDPFFPEEKAREMGVVPAEIPQILEEADFITVHVPLTKETNHLLDARAFARMKDGVRIVNCARGGIVDEEALYEALKSGKVAAAGLDVFEKEPPGLTALIQHPNVVVTPHLGASTQEAQENVAIDVAEELAKALRGEAVKNAVNIPHVPPEALAMVKPFMNLAERLGSFHAQLVGGRIQQVEVLYSGLLSDLNVGLLTTAVLKGLLHPILGDVNIVNAAFLARQRGIRVVESRQRNGADGDYSNLITLTVQTDRGRRKVSGTLFGKADARIVQVDDFHVDAILAGTMLVCPHIDRPGIIGKVGTVTGKAGINIATMQVGRQDAGGPAVMILGIDQPPSLEVLKELRAIPGVQDVHLVEIN
ncbi:MAG: phosphoglycerate dehydrogenase [Syntrophothermus sp.]